MVQLSKPWGDPSPGNGPPVKRFLSNYFDLLFCIGSIFKFELFCMCDRCCDVDEHISCEFLILGIFLSIFSFVYVRPCHSLIAFCLVTRTFQVYFVPAFWYVIFSSRISIHCTVHNTIRYDSVYLTCSEKLTGSQLSLPHRTNKKLKCETKNK